MTLDVGAVVTSDDLIVRASRAVNPRYPSSWWAFGFSHEVRTGEVVPLRALERDLMLWRDMAGTLHCHSAVCPHLGANIGYGGRVVDDAVRCPFHGYRFDRDGAVCARVEESDRAPRRLSLERFVVRERYGAIYLWNGSGAPDHDVPGLDQVFPERPDLAEHDVAAFHVAFHLPFAAKHFAENVADANHFGATHGACAWGDIEPLEETAAMLRCRVVLHEPVNLLSVNYVREQARLGQLSNPSVAGYGMTMTTFGGGLHVVAVDRFSPEHRRPNVAERLLDMSGAARAIISFSPVTFDTSLQAATFLLPGLRVPRPRRLFERLISELLAVRLWGATVQDCVIMQYRQEQPDPVYGRLDRGLVRFRRFWDSRIEDRSTWAGDGLRSNGSRAGIRWEDAPRLDEQPSRTP